MAAAAKTVKMPIALQRKRQALQESVDGASEVQEQAPDDANTADTTALNEDEFAVEDAPEEQAREPVTQEAVTQESTSTTQDKPEPVSFDESLRKPVPDTSREDELRAEMQRAARQYQDQIQALADEVKALKEANTSKPAPAQPAQLDVKVTPESLKEVGLTDEQIEKYSQSIPVIQHISTKIAQNAMEAMRQELDEVRGSTKQLESKVQDEFSRTRTMSYESTLRMHVPDVDELSGHPQFKEYLAKPIPYSGGETVRDRLARAHHAADVAVVKNILDEFRSSIKGQADTQDKLKGMQSPASVSASDAPTPAEQGAPKKRRLAWSKRKNASRQFLAGHIDKERFDKIKAMYDKAHEEGRIDYDA